MSESSHATPEQTTAETQTSETSQSSGSSGGSSHAIQLKGLDYGAQVDALSPGNQPSYADQAAALSPVQMRGGDANAIGVQEAAAKGVAGSGGSMPHGDVIQKAFGAHDISNVQAHVGGAAAKASKSIGAEAYATGNNVAFSKAPSLHTAAHEAAHVVQQRQGVSLKGGVGAAGDSYEQHADAVADAVVRGESVEGMLGPVGGSEMSPSVQRKDNDSVDAPSGGFIPPPGSEDSLTVGSSDATIQAPIMRADGATSYFELGSHELLPGQQQGLISILEAMVDARATDQLATIEKVSIEGYACVKGEEKNNSRLSHERALSVAEFLMDSNLSNAETGLLAPVGLGETGTIETETESRRVDVRIHATSRAPKVEPPEKSDGPDPARCERGTATVSADGKFIGEGPASEKKLKQLAPCKALSEIDIEILTYNQMLVTAYTAAFAKTGAGGPTGIQNLLDKDIYRKVDQIAEDAGWRALDDHLFKKQENHRDYGKQPTRTDEGGEYRGWHSMAVHMHRIGKMRLDALKRVVRENKLAKRATGLLEARIAEITAQQTNIENAQQSHDNVGNTITEGLGEVRSILDEGGLDEFLEEGLKETRHLLYP